MRMIKEKQRIYRSIQQPCLLPEAVGFDESVCKLSIPVFPLDTDEFLPLFFIFLTGVRLFI